MKKISIFISLLILIIPAYAYEYDTGSAVALQGAYGDVLSIDITPMKAQSQEYMAGMPFNIADNSVRHESSGRGIAEWSFISNTDFNIKVNAEPLYCVNQQSVKLNYELIFQYELGYTFLDEPMTIPGSFTIQSNSNYVQDDVENQPPHSMTSDIEDYDPEYFIGSAAGMIFFRLQDGNDIDSVPAGNYQATVEVLLETGA